MDPARSRCDPNDAAQGLAPACSASRKGVFAPSVTGVCRCRCLADRGSRLAASSRTRTPIRSVPLRSWTSQAPTVLVREQSGDHELCDVSREPLKRPVPFHDEQLIELGRAARPQDVGGFRQGYIVAEVAALVPGIGRDGASGRGSRRRCPRARRHLGVDSGKPTGSVSRSALPRGDFSGEQTPLPHARPWVGFAASASRRSAGREERGRGADQAVVVDGSNQPGLAAERLVAVSTDTPASEAIAATWCRHTRVRNGRSAS